jgi:hypothetical protein
MIRFSVEREWRKSGGRVENEVTQKPDWAMVKETLVCPFLIYPIANENT